MKEDISITETIIDVVVSVLWLVYFLRFMWLGNDFSIHDSFFMVVLSVTVAKINIERAIREKK